MQGFQQQTTCSSMAEKGVIPGRRRSPGKSYLIKGQWTPDEDERIVHGQRIEEEKALIKAHEAVGNRWTEIAKNIPGRTENSVKNHWNTTKRRRLSKKGQKAAENGPKKSRSSLLEDYMRSKIMEMD